MGGALRLAAWVAALVVAAGGSALGERLLAPSLGVGAAPIAVCIGALLGLVAAAPLYLSTRARLRRLARATRALAQGDFDAPLPPPADDDLGELQRAWKRMRMAMEEQVVELRGEAGRQRSILEGMAEGVALLQDGEIIAANPAFARLIGASGQVDGKTPLEAARLPELAEVIEESVRRDAEVAREIAADPRTLRVAARPLGGRSRRTVVVLLDMTETRRLERLRRDFVANASHELRTPVAAIQAAAETLAGGAADDAAARNSFVDILGRHALRLSELTADLLDLARLEAGYRPRVEEVVVPPVIDAVLLSLSPRAHARQLTISTQLEPPTYGPLAVAAERAAVEQILTNLVDNAIKYTPAGGRIAVGARALDETVELTVADTGPGIPAEHLPRLFERFYRVDHARSRELGGTGLGLSIVKHLVAAHGGEIRVESEVGRGSHFIVLLPRPDAAAKSSHERHKASAHDR
jgi:two-component system phosphate regulon sensor histidine kinase PhoR